MKTNHTLNRRQAPIIVDAVNMSVQLPAIEQFRLANEVPVYAFAAPQQEVAVLELVFSAGHWFEAKAQVSEATNYLLKNGTRKHSAFEINELFDFHGAYVNRSCGHEVATLTLHCMSRDLPTLLPMLASLATEAAFPEQELSIYAQQQVQKLAVNLKKPDFVANRKIDEFIFGFDHPYGRYYNAPDYQALSREDLLAYYDQFYRHGQLRIFAAGNLPANLETLLNDQFGHLPLRAETPTAPAFAPKPHPQRKHRIINDEAGVQGAIRICRSFLNRQDPEFPEAQVLNNLFGGYFGSRLMTNIREDKGYTYGIHSYLQPLPHGGIWNISTEAGRDVCEATVQEVYTEMEKLRNEPVDAEELDLVRNYMIGTLLGDLDGPFQVINRWKTYVLNGLGQDYFERSLHIIRTITPQQLQGLAQRWLRPEDFYELVVV